MKVKIQGTIVSPDYDDGFFESWIDKGVITPSSRVVGSIENATEPIDLYINSYGGDVFAGGEMMIALLKASATGKLASVEVGTIAASMAANIVAALRANGVPVTANANSELMFHGCYTETVGGAQHHEDVAESLRNVNESVIANLNRIGITECRAWFAEGREKWIGAEDGLAMGLFSEINGTEAEAPTDAKSIATKLAALASSINTRKDYAMSIDDTIPTANETVAETASEEVKATDEGNDTGAEEKPVEAVSEAPVNAPAETPADAVSESDIEARVTALANARFAGLQAKHDKMISELKAKLDESAKSLASVTSERDQLKGEVETLTAGLADLRDQLAAEKSAHESVVANVLSHVGPEHGERKNARETLASLPASKRAEFYKAHKAEIDR
jgi:ATP-dependent Clp protease, protease subunit